MFPAPPLDTKSSAVDGVDANDLVAEAADDFRVHASVYTDPAVFDAEMERIFAGTWVYVGHASQVPSPGDYLATTIGRRRVVLVREMDGGVRTFLLRCLACGHEPAVAPSGRVDALVCRCTPTAPRLEPVPRTESYRGLIFANLRADGPGLDVHLAPVKGYIDCWLGRSPVGSVTVIPTHTQYEYAGNWKWQAENGTDAYHGNYVHDSWQRVLQRAGESKVRDVRRYRDEGCTRGMRYGHGMIHRPAGLNPNASWTGRMMRKYPEYEQALRAAYDPAELEKISGKLNIYIFPNLYLFDTHIRIIEPLAVERTRIDMCVYALDGVPDLLNEGRYRAHERFFGNGGFGTPDDIEVFLSSQMGARASAVDWMVMSRGMHRERVEGEEHIGHSTDEVPVRALYREWRRLMTAGR